jgi:hypothetical protein
MHACMSNAQCKNQAYIKGVAATESCRREEGTTYCECMFVSTITPLTAACGVYTNGCARIHGK